MTPKEQFALLISTRSRPTVQLRIATEELAAAIERLRAVAKLGPPGLYEVTVTLELGRNSL